MGGVSAAASWSGPWEAHFEDGPRKGDKRVWAVGPVWKEIRVAPTGPLSKLRWFISGGDGISPAPPGVPGAWPEEIRYVLVSTKHKRIEGQMMVIAEYRLSKGAAASAR
jgi:hypothetical protein